ncbi:uncharacterized protein BP5553_01564 [Venustampulla echinocandica]|uniref:Palmitoyltransferase n=1 Tax=Venustampulla echinocandica TaxID=2656787 RepID=A0A370U1E7_9HELO|nr:uncharacterized protein BP5553_01564 [Venustampulla echinocandica]RDL41585.1 hypothetical protein BP5553_01564 [Venustampulla echinocandica]
MRNARSQKVLERNIATNIWTARVMPLMLVGVAGYATYVTIALLCINYLLVKHDDKRAAIPILVVYLALLLLMATFFLRLYASTIYEPPYVPLGPAAVQERRDRSEKAKPPSEEDGLGMGEYNGVNAKDNLDSPGLELFYTKDIFVCEPDGKPIWCQYCANWKPDRTHHDSSSGRCIARMDHFCPWVGGPVGENNFKFFIQFTFWTAMYCLHLMVVMAFFVHRQLTSPDESLNSHFAAILAMLVDSPPGYFENCLMTAMISSAFFFFFTASMAGTSLDLAIRNLTTVERLGAKTKVHLLAIRKPSSLDPTQMNPYMVSNPPYRQITYPLNANGFPPEVSVPSDHSSSVETPTTVNADQPQQGLNQQEHKLGQTPVDRAATRPVHDAQLATLNDGSGPSYSRSSTTEANPPRELANEAPEMMPVTTSQGPNSRIEKVSSRDLKATRTFAVLKTEPGVNPWDLGSPLLNLKVVMGNRMIDWFLPTRSPCANHEDPESQFQLGPAIDKLRKSYFPFVEDARVN